MIRLDSSVIDLSGCLLSFYALVTVCILMAMGSSLEDFDTGLDMNTAKTYLSKVSGQSTLYFFVGCVVLPRWVIQ